ncbi:MAG: hypothetical protein AB7P76_10725 [Candidatus Melainabacteria bacterium]
MMVDPAEATSAVFTAGGLAELKGSGASNVAPVTEDADWIQNNLAMARRPVSMRDLMASEAMQRQADLSRMALEARLDNEIAQTELARAQAQEIRWRQYEARRQARATGEQETLQGKITLTTPVVYKGVNVTEKIARGEVPTDGELNQLFHEMDLRELSTKKPWEKITVQQENNRVIQRIAANMTAGPDALITEDGYVIINRQAYGRKEAMSKAMMDLFLFRSKGIHLVPLPYPTRPDLAKSQYPDVTEEVNKILLEIPNSILNSNSSAEWLSKVIKNFPDNGMWDLQVNYGLPGQMVIFDTKEGRDIRTVDQYAIFRGAIRRSGYISNFAYGYGIAAAKSWKGLTETGSYFANLFSKGEFGDNPEDVKAMHDGYDAFWEDHRNLKRYFYEH